MTPEKTKKVLTHYLELLVARGVVPQQLPESRYDELYLEIPLWMNNYLTLNEVKEACAPEAGGEP